MTRPVIAVTPSIDAEQLQLKRAYTDNILDNGGLPVVIPHMAGDEDVDQWSSLCDGLLLTGGADVDPSVYGEEPHPGLGSVSPDRDRLEVLLVRRFLELDKPIYAVCRGHQLLNAAAGGTLYQDISQQCPDVLQHRQNAPRHHLSHTVTAADGSRLAQIAGVGQFRVNSFHHQAVKDVAPGFCATAWSADGLIEAIESTKHRYVVGVQWHPEDTTRVDPISARLFAAFVEACRTK